MIVVRGPCKDCGSSGYVPVGEPRYIFGEAQHEKRFCPRCAARTALALLLVKIGSWTPARWDQHVRDEYGDEVASILIKLLADWIVPVDRVAGLPVSAAGVLPERAPEEEEIPIENAVDLLRRRSQELRDFANRCPGTEGAFRSLKTAEELGRLANILVRKEEGRSR